MGLAVRSYPQSAEQIEAMLLQRLGPLARALAPDGYLRGHEWVARNPARADGTPGSFSINLTTGKWADFATGDKGGGAIPCLALIAYLATGGEWGSKGAQPGAFRWARDWLGLTDTAASPARHAAIDAEAGRAAQIRAAEEAQRVERNRRNAHALWLEAMPLQAKDQAGAYLAGRGIDLDAVLPLGALRFHPRCPYAHGKDRPADFAGATEIWEGFNGWNSRHPALLACMSDERVKGGFAACHRTYLKRAGGAITKAFGAQSKKILGTFAGASIRLSRGASDKPLAKAPAGEWIAIAEGIENALSATMAKPGLRMLAAATLSNLGQVHLPEQLGGTFVIADNDAPDSPASAALEKAVNHLAFERGLNVKVVRAPDGFKDFNDALRGRVSESSQERSA